MRADRSYLYDKTYNFMNTTHHTHSCVHDTVSSVGANNFGMNDRIKRLRRQTFEAQPSLSIERALIETRFYRENYGKYPIPILRALNFLEICKQKTIYIGKDELIVGERGPKPKCVPTFPELTCHSVEDLHVLNTRESQRYTISQEDIDTYEREVIPNENVSSAMYLRSGRRPMRWGCLPNLWNNVLRDIPLWTERCISTDCWI